MSFSEWMDKPTVVHPYHGILFFKKEEITISPGTKLDDSQRHSVEWKEPVSKSYVGEEKNFFYSHRFGDWSLGIKLTEGNRRKGILIYWCWHFYVHMTSQKRSENSKTWSGLGGYIPCKQRMINCGDMIRQRKEVWVSRGGRLWGSG